MLFFNKLKKILAAKTLQIFDLEQKAKVKTHLATEEINFWKWINADTIGIVTEASVYHWSLSGNLLGC